MALTVVIMPERDQVYGSLGDRPNRTLSPLLSDLGMTVLDLLPGMRRAAAEGAGLWHDIPQGHLSVDGHRWVARVLMTRLAEHGQAGASCQ